ncbi:10374_t:CDS:2 [Entrophospora sp. SA101]|nr:10374_t:CDS:2 [Entrophospora sp. SA101]
MVFRDVGVLKNNNEPKIKELFYMVNRLKVSPSRDLQRSNDQFMPSYTINTSSIKQKLIHRY